MNEISKKAHLTIVVVLAIMLSACADLEAVRSFSKQSATLTSSTEAIDYYATWDERSKTYNNVVTKLPPIKGAEAKGPVGPISPPSKEEVASIKALQTVLSAYMEKLGALAGDDIVDVSKQVDGLVGNLNKLPSSDPAEQQKTNAAYGAILKLLKLPLDAYRNHKIKELVTENDENIKALTRGLSTAMESVSKFAIAEKSSVINWYDLTNEFYPPPKTFGTLYLLEKDRIDIANSYDKKIKAIDSYSKALSKIGSSHSEIARDLSTFNSESLKRLTSSLQDARRQIIDAREQYEKAFN